MDTNKIKSDLIEAILTADDPLLLRELGKILEIYISEDRIMKLTDDQKHQVEQAVKQMDSGQGIPHSVAKEQAEEWLKD